MSVAIDGDILSTKCLHDKVGYDTPIMLRHAWSIGVEDADDLDANVMLTMVVEEHCLGTTLPLVVTRTYTDGIYIAPIALRLWMD